MLGKTAGLEIDERGGIRVDEQMRASNPDIFTVGDAIEFKGFVMGERSFVTLAGPANRQGRAVVRPMLLPGATSVFAVRRVPPSSDSSEPKSPEPVSMK